MNRLLTETEALQRLNTDAAAFAAMVSSGAIQERAVGTERFWPEEIELAAQRLRLEHGFGDALLAVGRLLATATSPEAIGTIAVRSAALLTGARDVAIYRREDGSESGWLTTLSRLSISAHDGGPGLRVASLPDTMPPPTFTTPTLIDIGSRRGNFGNGTRETRSAALVPLRAAGRLVGAMLAVDWGEPDLDAPTPLHVLDALAHAVAAPLALAIAEGQAHGWPSAVVTSIDSLRDTARIAALQDDIDGALRTIADQLRHQVPHDAIAVFRADAAARTLQRVFAEQIDPHLRVDDSTILRYGEGPAGRVALTGKPEMLNDVQHGRGTALDQVVRSTTPLTIERRHVISVPLLANGQLVGVTTVVRAGARPFSQAEFTLVQLFAGLATSALQDAHHTLLQQARYHGGIQALVSAVEAKDPYSRGHSERVSQLAHALAEAMGLPAATTEQVELGGLLHDIGKIGIPDGMLQKVTPLDDAERAVMMGHPALGAAILADSGAPALRDVIPYVRHHHEWFDGRGYPDGLSGDAIPIGAAIIGVADAFISMTTDLPYRARRTYDEALNELRDGASTQFHPAVIAAAEHLAAADLLPPYVQALPDPHRSPTGTQDLGVDLDRDLDSDEHPTLVAGMEIGRLGDLRALALMIELAGITSLIPELPEFLDRVATLLSHRLGLENVMIMLGDEEGSGLTVAALSGTLGHSTIGDHLPFGDNPWSDVYRTGSHRSLPNLAGVGFGFGDVESAMIVPLTVQNETIGLLFAGAARPGAFTTGDTAVLMAVAGQIANSVHVAQVHDAIKSAARTDGLTGLTNHRAFYQALEVATRDQQPIGVLLFDVVGLKEVNDRSSHLDGDLLLRTVARTIRAIVRPSDVVARYGGDEFAVILHGPIAETAAIAVGHRVNRALQDAVAELGLPPATLRFGVAMLPVDGITPHELVLAADRRMYDDDGSAEAVSVEPAPNGHVADSDVMGYELRRIGPAAAPPPYEPNAPAWDR